MKIPRRNIVDILLIFLCWVAALGLAWLVYLKWRYVFP